MSGGVPPSTGVPVTPPTVQRPSAIQALRPTTSDTTPFASPPPSSSSLEQSSPLVHILNESQLSGVPPGVPSGVTPTSQERQRHERGVASHTRRSSASIQNGSTSSNSKHREHVAAMIMQGRPPLSENSNERLNQKLSDFWKKKTKELESTTDFKTHQLPLARIKKIMKSDEDVRMISAEAPLLFSKACELFILELTLRAWFYTDECKRRTLQRNDIALAVAKNEAYDFLIDIVPRDEMKPYMKLDDPTNKLPLPVIVPPQLETPSYITPTMQPLPQVPTQSLSNSSATTTNGLQRALQPLPSFGTELPRIPAPTSFGQRYHPYQHNIKIVQPDEDLTSSDEEGSD